MEEDENFYECISFVRASKHRAAIMRYLKYDVRTPTEIGVELDIRTNHISNLLAELRNQGLVVCITPNIHKGRLYQLTDKGKRIVEHI